MTISIEYAQSELIKAYKNFHTTMNSSYADNKLHTVYWDADGNPFQITRLQYCQEQIDKWQNTLHDLFEQQWNEMYEETA
jgi:hypothetical protein